MSRLPPHWNGGIDPNTEAPYDLAAADAVVPVFYLGATYKVIPDRLAVGFGITDSFVGGGDYSGSEDNPPPYTGHQRYAVNLGPDYHDLDDAQRWADPGGRSAHWWWASLCARFD